MCVCVYMCLCVCLCVYVCVYVCVCTMWHLSHLCGRQHADDMTIKLWDWDKKWQCSQVFEGHSHYVMMIVLNPKDNNQFASASLDRTIKVREGVSLR